MDRSKLKLLQLVCVMLFALVAGVFWGTWFSLSRSMSAITPPTFLEVGKIMITNLGGPMRLLLPVSILGAVALGIAHYRRQEVPSLRLAALGVLLMSAAMAITLAVNVPLDALIAEWTVETLPDDWREIQSRWSFYHGLRTLLSVAALGSLVGSVLLRRSGRGRRYSAEPVAR